MERMKRRLDELELVQNNIKLMNELMSHYKPDSEEKLLLQVYTYTTIDHYMHSTLSSIWVYCMYTWHREKVHMYIIVLKIKYIMIGMCV